MKLLTLGSLRVRAAGGADGDGGGDGPAVLLCHGFGAPGDDLVPLHRVVKAPAGARWFFPEAPLSLDIGMGMVGRAWWEIDMLRLQIAMQRGRLASDLASETPAGLDLAADALRGAIEALQRDHHVDPKRMVIGGFSQGSMVTTEVTLHAGPGAFAGLVALSGTLLCRDRWRPAAASSAPGLKVFQSHGVHDPILPFSNAEALRDLLVEAGAAVTFARFGGQHEIPYPVIEALGVFLNERLG